MSLCADFPRHARSRGQSTCQAAYTLRISVCRATLLREISEPFEKWTTARTTRQISMPLEYWSGRQDSNLRPLAPHASALPGCATPRPDANDSPNGLAAKDLDELFELEPHLMDELLALVEVDLRIAAGEPVPCPADGKALFIQQASN